MPKPILKLKNVDNGFCRVYYRMDDMLYCFQLESQGQYRLYSCTDEGEPEVMVRATPFLNYFLDKIPDEDPCSTAQEFCAWVHGQPLPFIEHGPNGSLPDCLCNACTASIGDGP